jgi:hypothetical protein
MTLHFACGWVIRPNVDYAQLGQMAAEAGCELAAIAPLYKSQEGYMVMTFAAQVASEAQLVAFIKQAGVAYGLTHWYGVQQDYYDSGQIFDVAQMPPHVLETWMAGMQKYGEYNDTIRQQLEKTDSTPST